MDDMIDVRYRYCEWCDGTGDVRMEGGRIEM
jgi:hypothetical protein